MGRTRLKQYNPDLFREELGYADRDDLLATGYDLVPEEIELAVRWLELNDPDYAIGIEEVRAEIAHSAGGRTREAANAESTGKVLPADGFIAPRDIEGSQIAIPTASDLSKDTLRASGGVIQARSSPAARPPVSLERSDAVVHNRRGPRKLASASANRRSSTPSPARHPTSSTRSRLARSLCIAPVSRRGSSRCRRRSRGLGTNFVPNSRPPTRVRTSQWLAQSSHCR